MSTLYLETDEDITSAVDKLKSANDQQVQVVVPKRSTLLQSMINLKLLKKAADDHKKALVLVTSDRLSSHLAGRVGLAVAAKVGGEASVPETKVAEPDQTEEIDGGETGALEPQAGEADAETEAGPEEDTKTEADDTMPLPAAATDAATETKAKPEAPVMKTKALADEPKPVKTKRVPDFNALQKRVMWGILAVVVLIGLGVANWLLTSAKVTVFAKGNSIPVTANLTADPAAASTNIDTATLKAQDLTSSKDLSEQVPATGTQDVGTKASGQMTISNGSDSNAHSLPAGTKFSASGKVFDSTAAVTVPGASVCGFLKVCPGTATVNVQAEQSGDSYNLAPTSYTISGQSGLTAQGSQMSGGTTKTVTVVAQADLDKAVADMLAKDKDGALQDLSSKASSGYKVINETLSQGQANVSSDTAVGAQATNVNVKVTANYDVLALANDDLNKLLTKATLGQAGAGQQVYDDGLGAAQFTLVKKNAGGSQDLKIATTASAGPKIDTASLAAQLKGKKLGDANDFLGKQPGVDHADINITPSWHTSLPSQSSHIHITIKVAGSGG